MGHESSRDCCIDAIGGVMRQSRLKATTLDHERYGWVDADGSSTHSCATLIAGWFDLFEKLFAIIDMKEKVIEADRVSLSWITPKGLHKAICQQQGLPGFSRNNGFRNGQAHLSIICIGARLDVVPGMFHV